jgi:ATPase subunit of ABC transporter with duplicated ATPase domains
MSSNIHINDLKVSVPGKVLLEDTKLKIVFGKKYGLVGPNGIGKSTLLKTIGTEDIPIKLDYVYVEQEVPADDTPALNVVLSVDKKYHELLQRENELTDELERVHHDDEEGLNQILKELDTVSSELTNYNNSEAKAIKLLNGLGFTDEMVHEKTENLSGGWRMRVSLARALFMEPSLMMLDEPTNHLDMESIEALNLALENFEGTLIFVSHDREFVSSLATRVIEITDKKLMDFAGGYEEFLAAEDSAR